MSIKLTMPLMNFIEQLPINLRYAILKISKNLSEISEYTLLESVNIILHEFLKNEEFLKIAKEIMIKAQKENVIK